MTCLFCVQQSIAQTKVYNQPYRPQLHFSPQAHWMNDPNGMVYYHGIYHLFFQYYPNGTIWGPMHWGHAESRDLVHWKQLPIALYPDSLGYIFSGSAVVDYNNTSDFGHKGKDTSRCYFLPITTLKALMREKIIIKMKVLLIVWIMEKHGPNTRVTRY